MSMEVCTGVSDHCCTQSRGPTPSLTARLPLLTDRCGPWSRWWWHVQTGVRSCRGGRKEGGELGEADSR